MMKKVTKKATEKTKMAVIALVMLFLMVGCGKALGPDDLQEYISPDGTYSIEADKKYTVDNLDDIGVDNWLILESTEEIEDILSVVQLPKSSSDLFNWSSLADVIPYMEETYELTDADKKEIEKPENGQLSNMQAYSYEGTEDGYKYIISTVYAETDYAYYVFMNEEAMVKRHDKNYFGNVCASFKENAEAIEEKTSFATDVTDTIRWFNASNAILVDLNGWNYQLYGGLEANAMNQEVAKQILDDSWGVTDTDTAWETLNWLMTEGHRLDYLDDMAMFEEIGLGGISEEERVAFLLENFEVNEEEAEYCTRLYGRYEEEGEDAASGWDYNRALSQIANFYLAGYFTLEEAMDASLDVAKTVQTSFDSWDDYMESYFTGYEYWAEEDSEERRAIYDDLKNAADNPYSIDFNTKLEKSW